MAFKSNRAALLAAAFLVMGWLFFPSPVRADILNSADELCDAESFKVKLNPVCPPGSDKEETLFFEDAQHPILAVEASLPETNEGKKDNKGTAFLASFTPAWNFSPRPASTLLKTVDLLTENLFGMHFNKEISLAYAGLTGKALQDLYGDKWSKALISVYVCDDTNLNGRCSDEEIKKQITVKIPAHQVCRLPKTIPVVIWAGCQ